jgi:hypothetical protein
MTPYAEVPDLVPQSPCPYWTERYSDNDLAIRVALFSGPGS